MLRGPARVEIEPLHVDRAQILLEQEAEGGEAAALVVGARRDHHLPVGPRDLDADRADVVDAGEDRVVVGEDRAGEHGQALVDRLGEHRLLEVAPIVAAMGAVEAGDLGRAVGDVVGVAIGDAQLVEGLAPGDVVAADEMALVERLAVLGEELVGELVEAAQARVGEPFLRCRSRRGRRGPCGWSSRRARDCASRGRRGRWRRCRARAGGRVCMASEKCM